MTWKSVFIVVLGTASLVLPQAIISSGLLAADIHGAYGSYWQSSITLTNSCQAPVDVHGTLYMAGKGSQPFLFTVPAQGTVSGLLRDLLGSGDAKLPEFFGWMEIGMTGGADCLIGAQTLMFTPDPNAADPGAVFAELTPPFVVWPLENPTLTVAGLTPCGRNAAQPEALGGGEWRANLGLVNTSNGKAEVKVECIDGALQPSGNALRFSLAAREIRQFNDIRGAGALNLDCAKLTEPLYCTVTWTPANILVYAYGSNVNNSNNFPIYIGPFQPN